MDYRAFSLWYNFSNGNWSMFIRVINKFTNKVLVVDELTDFMFEDGYRHVEEVPTEFVNVHLLDKVKRQLSIQQWGF